MNEQEWANRLSADIEHESQGETDRLPSDSGYDALLDVAQQLAQVDFSSDSSIRETLRNQLLDRAAGQAGGKTVKRKTNVGRTLALAAAVLVMLTIATLTIPPLRAFAQEVLRQIGGIIFTNDETIAQQVLQGIPAPNEGNIPPEQETPYKPEIGIPPYLPVYIPDGYALNTYDTTDSSASYSKNEIGTDEYQNAVNYILEIQQSSSLVSSTSDLPVPYAVGDAQAVDVTVRGQRGIWIEQAPIGVQTNSKGGMKPLNVNMLIWEEGEIVFKITNMVVAPDADDHPLLTLDEMLRVAESLQKS